MPNRRSASLSSINANRLAGFDMGMFLFGASLRPVHQTDAHKTAAACCHSGAHPPGETCAAAIDRGLPALSGKSAQSPARPAPSTADVLPAPAPSPPSDDTAAALYTPYHIDALAPLPDQESETHRRESPRRARPGPSCASSRAAPLPPAGSTR